MTSVFQLINRRAAAEVLDDTSPHPQCRLKVQSRLLFDSYMLSDENTSPRLRSTAMFHQRVTLISFRENFSHFHVKSSTNVALIGGNEKPQQKCQKPKA